MRKREFLGINPNPTKQIFAQQNGYCFCLSNFHWWALGHDNILFFDFPLARIRMDQH
jgi:hypothetical protein